MRCGVSGGLQSRIRSISSGCTRRTRLSHVQCDASLRPLTPESRTKRCISSIVLPDTQSAKPRNICAAAGLIVPDPVTGTCLIHNICHFASTIIIIVATVRNVPQILKCWRSRSSFGLSAAALATEVSCYACTVAYGVRRGYAVTLWGSELACWLQDATLLALIAHLRGARLPATIAVCVCWAALKSILFTELVPMWFLSKFQIFVGLILGLGARVPQILLNHKNGHTGNLALPTYIFNTFANLVCCTSTAVITGDIYVITKEIWMMSLNATILTQIMRTLAKQREGETEQPKGLATSPMCSEEFEGTFRSRSRAVSFTGSLPAAANLVGGGDEDQRKGHGRNRGARHGEVIRPGSWGLDSSSPRRRAGMNPYSLDAEKLGPLDEYDRLKREKSGSMDGMKPSVA